MKALILVSMISLFCLWQNVYSQLLPMEDKISYAAPPYDNTINTVSPEIEKWMEEELSKKYEQKIIEMKTDVLGRVKKNGLDVKNTEYKRVTVPKQKRLVQISDMNIRKINIEPISGAIFYNPKTDKSDYVLNEKKVSEKEFNDYEKRRTEKLNNQEKGKRRLFILGVLGSDDRSWTALMTAEEISELIKNNKELAISDPLPIFPTASRASILSAMRLDISQQSGFYDGTGIGVYLTEPSCAIMSGIVTNPSKYTIGDTLLGHSCSSESPHHTASVEIIRMAAYGAHIYGFSDTGPHYHFFPPSPSSPKFSTPILIGSHSYCSSSTTTNEYTNVDMNMDNYIYEEGVTNFVAAGNYGECGPNYLVSSPGKAVNAITVGAVDPVTNNYKDYSRWGNSEIGNDKPELPMYTDIDFFDNPILKNYCRNEINYGICGGTSSATPLAAGFAAKLMQYKTPLQKRPALVKAALLAGGKINVNYATAYDKDNNSLAGRKIPDYMYIAMAAGTRFWEDSANFNNSSHFVNGKIQFTETSIRPGAIYRIALAWLNTGTYVYTNKRLGQRLNIYVKQGNNIIAEGTNAKNPFQIVEFSTKSTANLTITIERAASDDPNAGTYIGYVIQET